MSDDRSSHEDEDRIIDLTGAIDSSGARIGEREGIDGPSGATSDPAWNRSAQGRDATEFLARVLASGRLVATSVGSWPGEDSAGNVGVGRDIAEIVHPDDVGLVVDLAERARKTPGLQESIRARARHRDGTWRVLEARLHGPAAPAEVDGVVLRVRDITDEHDAHVSPSDIDRFSALAEMLPLGILSADESGSVVYANSSARQLLDTDGSEIRGRGWRRRIDPDDWPEVARACAEVVALRVPRQVSFRVSTDLFVRWAQATFVPLGGPRRATGWIATLADITEHRSVEGRLTHQATHDMLTGLPNRSLLEDRLRRSLAGLRRDAASVAVIFLDLDGFKAVNDTFGHAAGDAVLVEVGRRLRQVTRDVDTVARLAGDEFVVVCESLDELSLDLLVGRIRARLEDPVSIGAGEVSVRSSLGVAFEAADGTAEELMARADQAMYRDKRVRRGER